MRKRLIYLLLLFTFSSNVLAQQIPDFSANYLVKMNGLQAGELQRKLVTHQDGTRQFTSKSQAKGMFSYFKPDVVTESSVFTYADNFIQPLSYTYQRTGGKKEKFIDLKFDWQQQSLAIDDRKHPWKLQLEAHTLDKLVYQIALMSDLETSQQQFNYRIADGGKLKDYNIQVLGYETISTPLGKIETIVLKRFRKQKSKRETTLWCAPALNYLPVQLVHDESSGATFTAVLRRLKGIDTSVAFKNEVSTTSNRPF